MEYDVEYDFSVGSFITLAHRRWKMARCRLAQMDIQRSATMRGWGRDMATNQLEKPITLHWQRGKEQKSVAEFLKERTADEPMLYWIEPLPVIPAGQSPMTLSLTTELASPFPEA